MAQDLKGESKGYGFVHFAEDDSARLAIEKVNGMLLEGKKVSTTSLSLAPWSRSDWTGAGWNKRMGIWPEECRIKGDGIVAAGTAVGRAAVAAAAASSCRQSPPSTLHMPAYLTHFHPPPPF